MRLRRSSLPGRLLARVLTSPRVLSGAGLESFEACLRQCLPGRSYLDPWLAAARVDDTETAPDPGLAGLVGFALGVLASDRTRPLRVVDFGGGAGRHHRVAVGAWGERFDWTVVETAALVAAARKRARPGLTFVASCSAIAARPDLCLAAGSLQYCADPTDAVQALAKLEARAYLLITTPILTAEQQALADRYWPNRAMAFHHLEAPRLGPGLLRRTACPVTFLTRAMLSPLAAGRRLLHEASEGPIYRLRDLRQTVECWTLLWG